MSVPYVGFSNAEVDRLQLHNLLLQQQALRAQLNLLTFQFLQTLDPRSIQDRIDDLTVRINATADKIFASRRIDPKTHNLELNEAFCPRVTALDVRIDLIYA